MLKKFNLVYKNYRLPLFYSFLEKKNNVELQELNVNRRFARSERHQCISYIKKTSFKPISVVNI